MINIFVYGVDQFLVGDISRDVTSNLSTVFEVDEDEINFIACNNMLFHNGVDQTSWNALIKVEAPEELERVQENASKVLLNCLGEACVHVEVIFSYYCRHDRFVKINDQYPRFITDENVVEYDSEYDTEMQEGEGDDEIFTGDIFEEIDNHHHEH